MAIAVCPLTLKASSNTLTYGAQLSNVLPSCRLRKLKWRAFELGSITTNAVISLWNTHGFLGGGRGAEVQKANLNIYYQTCNFHAQIIGNAIVWDGGDTIHRAGIALDCFGYESNIFQCSTMSYISVVVFFLIKERCILFQQETIAAQL